MHPMIYKISSYNRNTSHEPIGALSMKTITVKDKNNIHNMYEDNIMGKQFNSIFKKLYNPKWAKKTNRKKILFNL